MNSFPIEWSVMARQQVTRSGAPLAGLLVSGFVLVSGAFVGGAALAQQYSASQSAGQTSGQTTGQVDLLSTVQDNGGQGTDLPSPTISSIDEAIEVISGGADKDGATASSMEDAASLTDNATGNATGNGTDQHRDHNDLVRQRQSEQGRRAEFWRR
jgi:hypothetical protein